MELSNLDRLFFKSVSFGILSELTTHATRGRVAKTPYFPETISCLALIIGDTGDSGRNSGFRWTWKVADNPERVSGELKWVSQIRDQG
jgi:hypothetical protein